MNMNNIGSKIKSIREEMGLNQKQVAAFLGVDQSLISKFESSERKLNLEDVNKLCNLFGCSLQELLGNDSPRSSLSFAFRASGMEDEDLSSIAEVNRIAMNILEMHSILEEK